MSTTTRAFAKKDDPLVSIIIPVYNSAKFLSECLDSLLHQNYKNLEIICIDDGSTDSSPAILNYYQKQDKRIICMRQENAGQSVARNKGLHIATGKYVCFLDSDDFLIPNAIYQCIEVFATQKVDVVLYNMEMFLPSGAHFKCFSGPLYQHHKPILRSKKDEISVNFTNAAAGMYNRQDLLQNNIVFPAGIIYEDWVFMIKLMTSKNFKIFWLDSPLYWYRRDFVKTTTSDISPKCLDLFKAYHLSNDILKTTHSDERQVFINDEKIVNESVGFLLSRICFSKDEALILGFVQQMLEVFRQFPEAYFECLCSFLTEERATAARYLYTFLEHGQECNINELTRFFHKKNSFSK